MRKGIAVALVGALVSAGCMGMHHGHGGRGSRAGAGTVVGGVAGGIAGSAVGGGHGRTAAIIAGTLIGAIIGQEIGRSIDRTDELHAARALEHSRSGEPTAWVNPDTGAQVSVTPTRTWQRADDQYCREYQTEVTVGGERQQAYGTACRQPDGSWKVVN